MKQFPYQATALYVVWIVFLNSLFNVAPLVQVAGTEVSPLEALVGIVFVLRDFAQRELGHKVFLAMLTGAGLSYFIATPQLAFASMVAFMISEVIDWAVYTFTKRPLSKRILWSALLSSPVDSFAFLYLIHLLNGVGLVIMTLAKMLGAVLVWWMWRSRQVGVSLGYSSTVSVTEPRL